MSEKLSPEQMAAMARLRTENDAKLLKDTENVDSVDEQATYVPGSDVPPRLELSAKQIEEAKEQKPIPVPLTKEQLDMLLVVVAHGRMHIRDSGGDEEYLRELDKLSELLHTYNTSSAEEEK